LATNSERPAVERRFAAPAGRWPQRQEREHQLGETVALLEMRVSGKDESVDAEGHVFAHPLGDLMWVTDQGGAGAAAHQANAGPEIRADPQVRAVAAVQPRHALLADRVHPCQSLLRRGDDIVGQMLDKRIGISPGCGLGLSHDHVQADAETQFAPMLGDERDAARYS
jgi:hypothetical protein